MGLIAQRVAAAVGELRFNAAEWINDDDYDPGAMTSAGVRVTTRGALGLSVFWRCVDMLSSAAAFAPKDIIVKVGGRSFEQYGKPAWMTQPRGVLDPTFTIEDHFAQVALSLLVDGNYFVHVFPAVWDPQVLTVLDPSRVRVIEGPRYELLNDRGQVERTVDWSEMLHGKWLPYPGELRGISPLETLRRTFGSAIAAEDFAARFFGQGAALSFGVEVPYQMDATKLGDLRESLKAKYVGNRNSHAIGVLADGGKFVTGLAPTPEQAQMLETRKFAVEDIARIFGIPPGMVGSQEPGASSYASSETWKDNYRETSLQPFVGRFEPQYSRLVAVPPTITDPTAYAQFRFNLDAFLRVDPLKRMQTYREGIQAGVYTPNYARGKEDLPPLPGGDVLYMQAQMTPITMLGTQTPAGSAAPDAQEAQA